MNIKDKVIAEIKKIYDPEIPVNIYELGLIYDVSIDEKNKVYVKMTLTTPNCPVAESLPKEVKDTIKEVLNRPIKKVPSLRDITIANLFFENSTRTKLSFEQSTLAPRSNITV